MNQEAAITAVGLAIPLSVAPVFLLFAIGACSAADPAAPSNAPGAASGAIPVNRGMP